jgi:hypothetical protein
MARHPIPGRVKTRLAAELGAEAACELYQAFVLDLADRLRALAVDVTWRFWPPEAPFGALVPGMICRPQRGENLGERLLHAVRVAFDEAAGPVVVIGTDAPHVPVDRVMMAAVALGRGADAVVGPTVDGGYYLIGLRVLQEGLFRDVPWGTSGVLETTLRRAHEHGLRMELLPASFDVDRAEDLSRLRSMLVRGEVILPRTAAMLGC